MAAPDASAVISVRGLVAGFNGRAVLDGLFAMFFAAIGM